MTFRDNERGQTVLELVIVISIIVMFLSLVAGALSRPPSPIGRSTMEFRAMLQNARALAATTAGDLNASDGTTAVGYAGSTLLVEPRDGGGSKATLYRYRPVLPRNPPSRDLETDVLLLDASVLAVTSGGQITPTFAVYFSSSGHLSVRWGLTGQYAASLLHVYATEPVCDNSSPPTLSVAFTTDSKQYALDCVAGSMANDPL